ncbi:MAG TPA: flavodoxin domain-containing protein [Kofleriaceae bacterium]|jgi:menaquinone-dependent protoporphyrinogen oxidase
MDNAKRLRVLVTYGSKREGTREIANAITDVLREQSIDVDCSNASFDTAVDAYDAVIVGGALYMSRWHPDARQFITHHAAALRRRPVWLFSSGPLDLSASDDELPPTLQVQHLMKHVGARGHATFGGRLAKDARGFPASAMARSMSGDFRDWDAIRRWAADIATRLKFAPAVDHHRVRERARWPLALACGLVGGAAAYSGLQLALHPDGHTLRMPSSFLQGTPFSSYLIPGLLLALVIGAGYLFETVLVLRRSPFADVGGVIAGAALVTWIVVEMLLLGTANALQLGMLVVAVVILGESLRRIAVQARLTAVPRGG